MLINYFIINFLKLNNDLVSNVYIGDEGKIHVVKGGADTGLNFSSISNLSFEKTTIINGIVNGFIPGKKYIIATSDKSSLNGQFMIEKSVVTFGGWYNGIIFATIN